MWRYLGRRLIQVPLVLVVVSLMTFLITRATPGDPVQIMLGMQTSKEAAEAIRKEFNLDRSLAELPTMFGACASTGTSRSVVSVPGTTLISRGRPSSSNTSTVKV